MKAESFRPDLYYRLSVVTLDVPPLRHHPEDVPILAERYLADFRVRLNSQVASFSAEAMQALASYSWPGNIRELINVVERSVLLCEGDEITLDELPRTLVPASRYRGGGESSSALDVLFEGDWQSRPWKDVRNAVVGTCEQAYFLHQLGQAKGNVDDTARRAEINPRSLYDLMKRHGLKKEEFK
jgi:DNA-binding NtrC family response regulator